MRRRDSRSRAITPATLAMLLIVASFVVALAVTRWGLDIYGPWLARLLDGYDSMNGCRP